MNADDNPTLVSIAEAVTDGVPVDWDGLKRRNPGLLDDLAALEAMADVAAAFRLWSERESREESA